MKAKQQFKENFTVENRFGYLSVENILLDGIKDDVKKAKTATFACITLLVTYLRRHCMTTTWVFLFLGVFSRTQISKNASACERFRA